MTQLAVLLDKIQLLPSRAAQNSFSNSISSFQLEDEIQRKHEMEQDIKSENEKLFQVSATKPAKSLVMRFWVSLRSLSC